MAAVAPVAPVARTLATRVLQHERAGHGDLLALAQATERADERLRRQLAGIVGQAGYTALISRAVHLAQQDFPALHGVVLASQTAGGLQGLREVAEASDGDPDTTSAGLTAILVQLFGLLVVFLGEDLTVRLVDATWPELAAPPRDSEDHG